MVKYTVKDYLDPFFVKCINNFLEVIIGAKSGINKTVISGVVAVCIRFKYGREINGIDAKFFHMRDPVKNFKDPVL